MPDRTMYTNEAALVEASEVKTTLAASLLRLFDTSISPDVLTPKADLVAAEITMDGYTVGGFTLVAWSGPLLAPGGGAVITSPIVNVAYLSGTEASIGGGWIEDSKANVRCVFIFDPPRTLAQVGDGFEFVRQLLYGRNTIS